MTGGAQLVEGAHLTGGDMRFCHESSKSCRFYDRGKQGGITCEAIDEPRKSLKAIDKHVIINFCDKNVVIARFRDINEIFI